MNFSKFQSYRRGEIRKRYLDGSLELPLYAESTGETPEDILEGELRPLNFHVNGNDSHVPSMKRLLSALCLNSLKEDSPLKFIPMEGLELIPDVETFGEQENQK